MLDLSTIIQECNQQTQISNNTLKQILISLTKKLIIIQKQNNNKEINKQVQKITKNQLQNELQNIRQIMINKMLKFDNFTTIISQLQQKILENTVIVSQLSEQNKIITTKSNILRQDFQIYYQDLLSIKKDINHMYQYIVHFQQNMHQIMQCDKININNQVQMCKQKIQIQNNHIRNQLHENVNNMYRKISMFQKQLSKSNVNQRDNKTNTHIIKNNHGIQNQPLTINLKQWVDYHNSNHQKIVIHNNSITAITPCAYILGSRILKKDQFIIQINKMTSHIEMGLVNIDYFHPHKLHKNNKNSYIFNSQGKFFTENRLFNRFQGFKSQQVISVGIDIQIGIIQFKIDGKLKIQYVDEKLSDSSIQWVPFILLINKQDQVSIIK